MRIKVLSDAELQAAVVAVSEQHQEVPREVIRSSLISHYAFGYLYDWLDDAAILALLDNAPANALPIWIGRISHRR